MIPQTGVILSDTQSSSVPLQASGRWEHSAHWAHKQHSCPACQWLQVLSLIITQYNPDLLRASPDTLKSCQPSLQSFRITKLKKISLLRHLLEMMSFVPEPNILSTPTGTFPYRNCLGHFGQTRARFNSQHVNNKSLFIWLHECRKFEFSLG